MFAAVRLIQPHCVTHLPFTMLSTVQRTLCPPPCCQRVRMNIAQHIFSVNRFFIFFSKIFTFFAVFFRGVPALFLRLTLPRAYRTPGDAMWRLWQSPAGIGAPPARAFAGIRAVDGNYVPAAFSSVPWDGGVRAALTAFGMDAGEWSG